MWHIPIELRRRIPEIPMFGDPSHIGGRRELVAPLCQQAMDLGFDGLLVESHCQPDNAWSDAKQQITPDVLEFILEKLTIRNQMTTTEGLETLRYSEILEKRGAQGALNGMTSSFIRDIFEHIHEESVAQQIEIMNK